MNRTSLALAAALALAVPALCAAQKKAEPPKPTKEYTQGVSLYKEYIERVHKGGVWGGNTDNLPFIMEHGAKRGRSIVLVHGLTDSPCYMRELAQVFYDRGYNVVGVRLRGHGTAPEDLQKATLEQWRDDVNFGIVTGAILGNEVSVAGFSTGGALALNAVYRRQQKFGPKWNLGDVYLFSPAIDLPFFSKVGLAGMCAAGTSIKGTPWAWGDDKTVEDNTCGYKKGALNGACQLMTQIKDNYSHIKDINAGLKGHGVYIVESAADATVSPTAVVDFSGALPKGAEWDMTLYEKSEGIAHNAVTLSRTNPHFGELKAGVLEFVERCEVRHSPRELSLIDPKTH